jgi:hypothetical protein
MRRYVTCLFISLLFFSWLRAQTATAPAAGDGSSGNPYQIATLENLYWIADQVNNHALTSQEFIQTADIDASATSTWFSNGSGGYYGWTPIGYSYMEGADERMVNFVGRYNGQGHRIDGLYINRQAINHVGLFGCISGSIIENIGVTNVNIVGGDHNIGGLTGYAEGSTISYCYASGTIRGYSNVGGLIGLDGGYSVYLFYGITNCYSSGIVSSTSDGIPVDGFVGDKIGGLVGSNFGASICKSFSTASVTGDAELGGLIGYNYTTGTNEITNCYSTGPVARSSGATSDTIGGFIGYNIGFSIGYCYSTGSVTFIGASNPTNNGMIGKENGGAYTHNFWDTQTSGQSSTAEGELPDGSVGKTTAEMKTLTTFTNASTLWDFVGESTNGTNDYWNMDATYNNGYPFQSWQRTTWNGSIWDQSSPTSGVDALINGNYNGAGVSCRNLVLNPGKKTTVTSGALNVWGNLTLKSDAGNGTATFIENGGTLNVAGTTTVEQYLSGTGGASATGRGWYLSSPLQSAKRSIYGTDYTVWTWSESTNGWTNPSNETTLDPTHGYVARSGYSGNVNFSGGNINNGPYSTGALSRTGSTNEKRGFHLIGNPYPSYLDWEAVTKTNILNATIWYCTALSGSTMTYDTYNANSHVGTNVTNASYGAVTQYIPPMQAFWVRVDADGHLGELGFTNAMRTHSAGNNPLRSSEASGQAIMRLQVSNGIFNDEAIILFNKNASDDFDPFDSPKMPNNNVSVPELFTTAGTEKVVINGLNSFGPTKELAIGFKTGTAGTFTLKASEINNFDINAELILEDRLLKHFQDLRVEPSYTFTSDVVNTLDRFMIHFAENPTGLVQSFNKPSIRIWQNKPHQITLELEQFTQLEGVISMFSMFGKCLLQTRITGETTILHNDLPPGVYLVTVQAGNLLFTRKVVLEN